MYEEPENKNPALKMTENPYPPIKQKGIDNRKWIHNVLMDEAKKAYRIEKYKEAAERWAVEDPQAAAKADIFVEQSKSSAVVDGTDVSDLK